MKRILNDKERQLVEAVAFTDNYLVIGTYMENVESMEKNKKEISKYTALLQKHEEEISNMIHEDEHFDFARFEKVASYHRITKNRIEELESEVKRHSDNANNILRRYNLED